MTQWSFVDSSVAGDATIAPNNLVYPARLATHVHYELAHQPSSKVEHTWMTLEELHAGALMARSITQMGEIGRRLPTALRRVNGWSVRIDRQPLANNGPRETRAELNTVRAVFKQSNETRLVVVTGDQRTRGRIFFGWNRQSESEEREVAMGRPIRQPIMLVMPMSLFVDVQVVINVLIAFLVLVRGIGISMRMAVGGRRTDPNHHGSS